MHVSLPQRFRFPALAMSALAAACLLVTVVALAGVAFAGTSPASAAVISLSGCGGSSLSQPFAPWADFDSYELAPGGDFEAPGWTLSAGAELVPGSDPFALTGVLGKQSLRLPAGARAISPPICVNAAHPTIRMMLGGIGSVAVYVVADGLEIPAGIAAAGGSWQPSLPLSSSAAVFGALSGGDAEVSIALVGVSGEPSVDDVFVDPWFRGN